MLLGILEGSSQRGKQVSEGWSGCAPMGPQSHTPFFCSPMLRVLFTPPATFPPALAGGPRQCLPCCMTHGWALRVRLPLLHVCPALLPQLYSLNQGAQPQCHLLREVPPCYIQMGSSLRSLIWPPSLHLCPGLPMLSADHLLSADSLCDCVWGSGRSCRSALGQHHSHLETYRVRDRQQVFVHCALISCGCFRCHYLFGEQISREAICSQSTARQLGWLRDTRASL